MFVRQIGIFTLAFVVSACTINGPAISTGGSGQSPQASRSAPAGEFRTRFGFSAVPTRENTFDIIPRRTTMKEAYWCAAGDYARRALGLDWKIRLWVVEGYHKSATSAATSLVTFTTNPSAYGLEAPLGAAAIDMLAVGTNESVSTAFNRCRDVEYARFGW